MRQQPQSNDGPQVLQTVRQSSQEILEQLHQQKDQTTSPQVREWLGFSIAKIEAGIDYAEKAIGLNTAELQSGQFVEQQETNYRANRKQTQAQMS
jgi:hypothetical protein